MSWKFKKGDTAEYCGVTYRVVNSPNNSDLVVLQAADKRGGLLYVWGSKCRRVR